MARDTMESWLDYPGEATPGIEPRYDALGGSLTGTLPSGFGTSGNFFSDPSLAFLEQQLRKRIGDVQTPLTSTLPSLDDFRGMLGGLTSSGSGGAGAPADVLGTFRNFAAGFQPSAALTPLQTYAGGRSATSAADAFTSGIAGLGPNTSLPDLQAYLGTRDPNAPTQTLQDFLASFNPLASYETSLASRVSDLRGDPFNDTVLQARKNAAFSGIEGDRQAELDRAREDLANRGLDPSSGVLTRANKDINARYDVRRSAAQNQLTQEEFNLRQENQRQADALEAAGASMRLQSGQIAAGLVSQIASLQQQGLSMTDALHSTVAQLGLQSREMEANILSTASTLLNQGYQMQDALQVALTQAGIQAQGQAADLQSQLASAEVSQRGQDASLTGMLAQSEATRSSSAASALMNFLNLQQQGLQYNDERQGTAVTLAAMLDNLVRQGLLDIGGQMPQLR